MWNPIPTTSGARGAERPPAGGAGSTGEDVEPARRRAPAGPAASGARSATPGERMNPAAGLLTAALVIVAASGCLYTFQAGAGLPGHAEIMAVEPFDNETGRFEITQEVQDALMEDLPRSFGVRSGGEDVADVLVRGEIRNYVHQTGLHRAGEQPGRADVVERQVTLSVFVEVIDLQESVILWDGNVSVEGEYDPDTETEDQGRAKAIERLVQRVVDGLQSNW